MKHLLPFRVYESKTSSGLTPRQEAFLNRYTQGTWSVNPGTGLVDVRGNFDCSMGELKSLQRVSFGHVSGYFSCYNNQLTTLVGAPQTVAGGFLCRFNRLTTLVGAPRTVGGNFDCRKNQLTTLDGAPQTVGGDFDCSGNSLTSLEGAPQTVNENFFCDYNRLTSLEGVPETVGGDLDCSCNSLTSLEGAPLTVDGYFYCYANYLTSLVGAPQTVGGDFHCENNQDLTSLVGAPQTVGGIFQSDSFELDPGEWNPSGWVKILSTGKPAARKLMKTLPYLQPDWWNSELQRDPGKTVHLLSSCWNRMPEDWKSGIVIPPGYEDEFGLFSGFDDLGLF